MNDTPQSEKKFVVTWDQYHRDARELAWKLRDLRIAWDAIVAVTRGGMIPAAIVARELNIRVIETFCVSSYNHQEQGSKLDLLKGLSDQFVNGILNSISYKVLVIDDLVDTGKTFELLRTKLPISRAHFATVYAKPGGRGMVDTFVTEVSQDTWIYQPWDTEYVFSKPYGADPAE